MSSSIYSTFLILFLWNLGIGQVNSDSVYLNVDRFPYAQECAEKPDLASLKGCTTKALLGNVQIRLKYPRAAREANIQGKVIVSFIIDKHGRISNPEVIKEPGYGLGEEVVRVINEISESLDFVPAEKEGLAVGFKMILPITYRNQAPNQSIPQDTYLVFNDSKGETIFQGMVSKEVQDAIPGKFIANVKTIDFVRSRERYDVIGAVNEIKFKRLKLVLPDEIRKMKVADIRDLPDVNLEIRKLPNLPQINISVLQSDHELDYYIHNLIGDVFAQGSISSSNGTLEKVDISNAPSGVLFATIHIDDTIYGQLLVHE